MDGTEHPPLPNDQPSNAPPPLPPPEPVPQSRPSKRLGIGDADGTVSNEPPIKKTRRLASSTSGHANDAKPVKGRKKLKASIGNRQPTAAELLALEDGELEDSDDSGVKDTYLVIEKKNRKKALPEQNNIAANVNNLPATDSNLKVDSGQSGSGGGVAVSNSPTTTALPESSGVTGDNNIEGGGVDGIEALKNPETKVEDEGMSTEDDDGNENIEEVDEDDNEINGGSEHIGEDFDSALSTLPQQFAVIDDLEDSDDENNQEDDDEQMDNEDFYDSDMDEEEVEALLDEDFQKRKDHEEKDFYIKEKEVIVERGHDPFDILPEGWIQLTHNSGIPVYLHKNGRVCTLARPYFLGTGSARRHDIPSSAIPCLNYRRSLTDDIGIPRSDDIPEEKFFDVKSRLSKASTQNKTDTEKENSHSQCELKQSIEQPQPVPDQVEGSTQVELVKSPIPTQKEDQDLNQLADDSLKSTSPTTINTQTENILQNESSQQDTSHVIAENTSDEVVKESVQEDKTEAGDVNEGDKNPQSKPNEEAKSIGDGDNSLKPGGNVKVTSVEEHKERSLLKPEQVREYCSKLYEFKKVYVKRFRSWKVRRAYHKAKQNPHKPSLPEGTKLIMCPRPSAANSTVGAGKRKEFVLNPKGKSDICILHEYAQHSLRVQPKYVFEETANALKPYRATILIDDIIYGSGSAASKKAAKAAAAHETLKILIPDALKLKNPDNKESDMLQDMTFFNDVKIEDPRVPDLSAKVGEPLPFEILQECLKRNFGLGDTNLTMDMKMVRPQRSEFTMKVSSYEAKVICKSKKEGKQKAAQVILQQMHPHVTSWGSLIRLYARDVSAQQEIKAQKDSITSLQCKVTLEPNHAILSKLKEEMHKLKDKRKQVEANIKGRIEMPGIELQSSVMGHVDLQ